jgi:hypothetical protein
VRNLKGYGDYPQNVRSRLVPRRLVIAIRPLVMELF